MEMNANFAQICTKSIAIWQVTKHQGPTQLRNSRKFANQFSRLSSMQIQAMGLILEYVAITLAKC